MAKLLLLACCSALFVLQGEPVQGADKCVLDGFDLTELQGARYWNITLGREKCVVPKNYAARDVTGCTVHFSICKPLPREICVNQANSSTCEVVTTNDGKIHYFNVGTSNTDLQPTGGNDVGFATIRQGNANDSALCNSTFITLMTFKCDPNSAWNRSRNDVTGFTKSSVDFETCVLDLTFKYNGACYIAPTLAPNRCQLDPYDLSGLLQMDYWSVALLDNQTCLIPDANPCIVYFSFCQGLPLSVGGGCYEAAVCQAGMTSEGDVSYSMGRLSEHTQFWEDQNDFTAGGFYISVEGGDTICTNADKKASTRIVLICDPMALWSDRNLSGKARVTQVDCEYTITIPYDGACLPPASTSTSAPSSTAQPTKSSSVNSTTIPRPTVTPSSMMTSSVSMPMPTISPTSFPTTGPPTTGPTTPNNEPTTPKNEPTTPKNEPTTPKKNPTTQPTAKPNGSKIAGLTAGLVIFMLIALVLLVLFIIAAYYIYKSRKTGEYERLQDSDRM